MADAVVLTAPQARALAALVDLSTPPEGVSRRIKVYPRQIAYVLWPDSPGWGRATHRTDWRAGAVGGTMPMKAAQLLWRLRSAGLARTPDLGDNGWLPTIAGLTYATKEADHV